MYTIDEGFLSTASCTSKITYIDGDNGILLYRGYGIDEISEKLDYVDVCHLLLNGNIPVAYDKAKMCETILKNQKECKLICDFIFSLDKRMHPMGALISSIGAVSGLIGCSGSSGCSRANTSSAAVHDSEFDYAMQLISFIPIMAAMFYANRSHNAFLDPKANSSESYSESFLKSMFPGCEINPVISKAFDKVLILHADHEQNASTTVVRACGSTGANAFACVAAGASTLWGPSHGGANEACLRMLQEISDEKNIGKYIKKAKDKDDPFRLMGFGHRVYKNYDPRAKVMQKAAHDVLEALNMKDDPLLKLALKLEKIALEDDYFISRKLYPNVDFYSGITLKAIGIPIDMFTVVFAIARTSGWMAHWLEMMRNGPVLVRPRQLYIGEKHRKLA